MMPNNTLELEKIKIDPHLFRKKNILLLISISNNPAMSISFHYRHVNMTYSHITKLIKKWRETGFLYVEKSGRSTNVTLTKKSQLFVDFIRTWQESL